MSIRRRPARGTCPHCKKEHAIRMTRAHAGTIRDHGPDCRGVGQPPVEPEAPLLAATPSPAEETAVEPSTEPGATVEPASAPERAPTPTYTRLDEDDGEIDGGAVPLQAETSHRDIPAEDEPECEHYRAATAFARYFSGLLRALDEPSPQWVNDDADAAAVDGHALGCQIRKRLTSEAIPEPSLLGMAQRSRIEQLEDEAGRRQIEDIEELRLMVGDLRVKVEGLERKLAGEEALCDRLTREASTLREEVVTLRATLSQALALIGRLSAL